MLSCDSNPRQVCLQQSFEFTHLSVGTMQGSQYVDAFTGRKVDRESNIDGRLHDDTVNLLFSQTQNDDSDAVSCQTLTLILIMLVAST